MKLAAPLLLLLLATSGAEAQSAPRDTVRLAEIVVTPTRVATPRASVAAAVTVLQGEALKERGITSVADALREVVGANLVQGGSFGALTSLFLRGGESDYTGVLVDGVPLNDPGGAMDLSNLTTDNVQRIEIVRGPASVLYGSDAVTGVVQIFTRRGRGPTRVESALEMGRYDGLAPGGATAGRGSAKSAQRWLVNLAGGADAVGYAFSVSRTATEGLYGTTSFDNSYRNTIASGLVRAVPDAKSDASLSVRYGDHLFHYPTDGAGRPVDGNQFAHGTSTALGLDAGRFLLPRLETRLMLAEHTTDGGVENPQDDAADTVGFYASSSLAVTERRRAEARANWYVGSGVVTLGGAFERQSQRSLDQFTSSFGTSTDQSDVRRLSRGAYLQVQGDPWTAFSVNAGARWDHSSTFGDFFTYRGGIVYRPLAGLRLRAAAGTGFKEPTFYENFATGFVRGNANLKPEHSTSWEIGAEQALLTGRALLTATYFSQRFSDLIDFTFTPPGLTDPNYFNVAGASARGVELEAQAAPTGRFSLAASYARLWTKVAQGGFDSGPGALLARDSTLLRRPPHTFSGEARVRLLRRARGSLAFRHVGERADLDYSTYPPLRVSLPAYNTLDAGIEGDVAGEMDRTLTLTLRAENLLDAAYQEAVNFPARQRTVWVGVRARF